MAAGSIVVDLLMKTGAFETDTKRAEKRLRELQKEAERVGKAIGVAFAATAAATALLVRNSLNAADAMGKLAQQTGVSVEALSGLSLAAERSGTNTETLARALQRISVDAAGGGSKLAALGVSLNNASGRAKTAEELFSSVADVFSKIPDGIDKTNAAIDLFGNRIGPQLIPLLNSGAEGLDEFRRRAESLNLVVSEKFAAAAAQFNDNIGDLRKAAVGFGNAVGSEVVPALNVLVEKLLEIATGDTVQSAFKTLASGARIALEGIINFGATVAFVFERVASGIAATIAQLRFLATLNVSAANTVKKAFEDDTQRKFAELQAFQERVRAARDLVAPLRQSRTGTLPPRAGATPAGRAGREQQQISFEELLARNAATRERIAQQEEDAATRLYERQRQFELDLQATRELAAQARIDAAENAANEFIRQQQAEADAIKDKLNPLREYERALERIAELERAGLLTEGESVAAVAQLSEAFRGLGREAKETNDIARSLGLTFSSAFEDAIAGGRGFTDILKSIERDLLRLGTRKLITEPLLGAFEGAFSGFGGAGGGGGFGGLFSGAAGFLRGLIPGFATGTDFVPRTGLALVHQGERIIPASENRPGVGGPSIVFNITTPDANSFRQSSSQIAAKMAMAVAAGQRNM